MKDIISENKYNIREIEKAEADFVGEIKFYFAPMTELYRRENGDDIYSDYDEEDEEEEDEEESAYYPLATDINFVFVLSGKDECEYGAWDYENNKPFDTEYEWGAPQVLGEDNIDEISKHLFSTEKLFFKPLLTMFTDEDIEYLLNTNPKITVYGANNWTGSFREFKDLCEKNHWIFCDHCLDT